MLVKTYKNYFLEELSFLEDALEAESFFYIVLEKLQSLKRIDLALDPKLEISDADLNRWEAILAQLKTHKPIQYILGETDFFGLPFEVNEYTLIPRFETEELVALILKNWQPLKTVPAKILDIGTGSGCIAISLAKNLPDVQVAAIDVSEKALETATRNAARNEVSVQFMLKNILETTDLHEQYELIVSNPPYVRNLEKEEIKSNVLEYEPHLALFVDDDDALIFYRKIAQLAWKNLSENGKLYFEINQYLGKETVNLLEDQGFKNVKLLKDIYENDRIIYCNK